MGTVWNIIGVIAGVLGVAFTVFTFISTQSEHSKNIQIELLTEATIVDETTQTQETEAEPQLHLTFGDRRIPHYVSLHLRVANIGGQPIRMSDYEAPIRLKLDHVSEILLTKQLSSDPKALQVGTSIKGQVVELEKVLLNPRDWFILRVGVIPMNGQKPTIEPLGRIVGVRQIEYRDSISPLPEKETIYRLHNVMIALLGAAIVVVFGRIQFLLRKGHLVPRA